MKGQAQGQTGKIKEPFPADWAEGKGKQNTKFKTKKGQKGKGYTAEEASIPESDAQDQWLEPVDTSTLHDTWQTDSSIWDWYPENDWEDAEANYQDWETSQDWQSSTSWFATGSFRSSSNESRDIVSDRVHGLPCRVSGQESDFSQFFVEDVTGHSYLSTKT